MPDTDNACPVCGVGFDKHTDVQLAKCGLTLTAASGTAADTSTN